jgi:RNA polymerase sigma-70 factor (ECF subfamily)
MIPTPSTTKGQVAALVMHHRESLYAYILACVRHHADAEDILQNVALAAVEADDPPLADERFLAWTREIARRRVLEHWRKSGRVTPMDPRLAQRLAEAAERVEQKRAGTTHREALLECVEKLPAESREILAARYADDSADVAAIAEQFGRTEQGVYSLLYRLRLILRDCIEQRLNTEGAG